MSIFERPSGNFSKIGRPSLLAASLLLTGCSNTQSYSIYYQIARESIRNLGQPQRVTLDQAAKIPYASLAYRLNGGNEALLVLATDTNGDQLWTSSSRKVLLTRDGRILRSVNLPHDRSATGQNAALPPKPADALQAPYHNIRSMDFADRGLFAVPVSCVATAQGRQSIVILGTTLATTMVEERCDAATIRWRFTDRYWVDADTGFVWRSLQHLHPGGDTIEFQILRPPE